MDSTRFALTSVPQSVPVLLNREKRRVVLKAVSAITALAVAFSPLPVFAANPSAPATLPKAPKLDEQAAAALAQATNPRVMMLRLYVADLNRAQAFYQKVFGANLMQRNSDRVWMMMFPGQALPGLVLIKERPEEEQMNGSFIIQVQNISTTLERALANGGSPQGRDYAQRLGAGAGQSTHFFDPDGNLIEALQIRN